MINFLIYQEKEEQMKKLLLITACISILALSACTATKQAPHMGFGDFSIKTQLERKDIVVMESVEGTSTWGSYLFGLVQVVDGDKYRILFIPFFKDRYSYGFGSRVTSRAYYKALESAPDADAIFEKSYHSESAGIPFIFGSRSVTVSGKAIKIIQD